MEECRPLKDIPRLKSPRHSLCANGRRDTQTLRVHSKSMFATKVVKESLTKRGRVRRTSVGTSTN